ncbi:MAG: hypothetical protein BWY67_00997 [Bacteroidetes bacterium ADurb.Bin397]|nr:MAG: hypothetical protein BWY67_00997 [Bacteroidetes bacterium ADurb.Bin397]
MIHFLLGLIFMPYIGSDKIITFEFVPDAFMPVIHKDLSGTNALGSVTAPNGGAMAAVVSKVTTPVDDTLK